ncbi:hypothetical protein CPB83DRAFT_847117 [Crepidotus variabilis]|uniref:Uncharacterized protein n=1 Tax=Crepidotus variabilis TaxID=179855 RepID=A0A9P6EMU4_9AGAR|nr:hypothetical protein CPB83DRAFT_847117 [Crepidotus variabilis]
MSYWKLEELQKRLGLKDNPDVFKELQESVKELTQIIFPADILPSPASKLLGKQRIARQVIQLYPDLSLTEKHKDRHVILLRMIDRDFRCRRNNYNKVVAQTKKGEIHRTLRMSAGEKADLEQPDSDSDIGYEYDSNEQGIERQEEEIELNEDTVVVRPRVLRKLSEPKAAPNPRERNARSEKLKLPGQGVSSMNKERRQKARLKKFLQACHPPVDHLAARLWHVGIQSHDDLQSLSKWSKAQRRQFFQETVSAEGGSVLTVFQLAGLEHQFESL